MPSRTGDEQQEEELPFVHYKLRLSKEETVICCQSVVFDSGVVIFHSGDTINYACNLNIFADIIPMTQDEITAWTRDRYANGATQLIPRAY